MKTTATNSAEKILLTVLFFSTVFLSCTAEKRHYRDGYYFGKSKNHSTSARCDDPKENVVSDVTIQSAVNAADTISQDTICSNNVEVPTHYSRAAVPSKRLYSEPANGFRLLPKHFPPAAEQSPQPVEPNEELATWFGVMAAIFFIGGILTLIAFGIGGPLIFVTALFFTCAVLCVIFASLFYPKTKPEKGKAEKAAPSESAQNVARLGALFLAGVFLVVVGLLALFLTAFF